MLGFLRDARCSVRVVEIRLFKNDTLYKRTPVGERRWEPSSDVTKTAQEITQYIADNGAVEATLVAADEVYPSARPCVDGPESATAGWRIRTRQHSLPLDKVIKGPGN
jgi:hypothetical protein